MHNLRSFVPVPCPCALFALARMDGLALARPSTGETGSGGTWLSTGDRAGRLYAAAILLATLGLWPPSPLANLSRCNACTCDTMSFKFRAGKIGFVHSSNRASPVRRPSSSASATPSSAATSPATRGDSAMTFKSRERGGKLPSGNVGIALVRRDQRRASHRSESAQLQMAMARLLLGRSPTLRRKCRRHRLQRRGS